MEHNAIEAGADGRLLEPERRGCRRDRGRRAVPPSSGAWMMSSGSTFGHAACAFSSGTFSTRSCSLRVLALDRLRRGVDVDQAQREDLAAPHAGRERELDEVTQRQRGPLRVRVDPFEQRLDLRVRDAPCALSRDHAHPVLAERRAGLSGGASVDVVTVARCVVQHRTRVGLVAGDRRSAGPAGDAIERVLSPEPDVKVAERLQTVLVLQPVQRMREGRSRRPRGAACDAR